MDQLFEFIGNHYLLVIAFLVVSFLLVQDLYENATRKYKSTSAMMAVSLMNQDNSIVVDVREPNEYARSHIQNAKNIPLGQIDDRASEIDEYKAQPVIVTCQAGTRSSNACKKLMKLGFEQIYNLQGGIQSWEEANLPLVKGKK